MDFVFRRAELSDLEALVALQFCVRDSLPHADMFAVDERDFYLPILEDRGHILLAEDDDGALAGASVIRFPDEDDPENLGHELALPEEDRRRVRHLESIFIRPDCQGHRLAKRLLLANVRHTDASDRSLLMATVWPLNLPSLRLHLELGLHIRAFALKYGGKPRFILMEDREREFGLDSAVHLCDAADFEASRCFLAQGMAGTGIRSNENSVAIEFRQILS